MSGCDAGHLRCGAIHGQACMQARSRDEQSRDASVRHSKDGGESKAWYEDSTSVSTSIRSVGDSWEACLTEAELRCAIATLEWTMWILTSMMLPHTNHGMGDADGHEESWNKYAIPGCPHPPHACTAERRGCPSKALNRGHAVRSRTTLQGTRLGFRFAVCLDQLYAVRSKAYHGNRCQRLGYTSGYDGKERGRFTAVSNGNVYEYVSVYCKR